MECVDPNKVPESQAFLLGHVGAFWVQFLLNFHPCELSQKIAAMFSPKLWLSFSPKSPWVRPTHFQDSEWRVQWWSNNTPVPECFSANERAYQPTCPFAKRFDYCSSHLMTIGVWRNNHQLEGFVKFSGISFQSWVVGCVFKDSILQIAWMVLNNQKIRILGFQICRRAVKQQ